MHAKRWLVRTSEACQRLLTVGAGQHAVAHLRDFSAVLAETYSASTFVISTSMLSFCRSHDSSLLSLLSRSAAKTAHQPSVPRLLLRKLPDGENKVSAAADILAGAAVRPRT